MAAVVIVVVPIIRHHGTLPTWAWIAVGAATGVVVLVACAMAVVGLIDHIRLRRHH